MKRAFPVIRVLSQLILAGPVLLYTPLAIIVGIGAVYFAARGESHGFSKDVGYGFGWLGLCGLLASILVPTSVLRKTKWARFTVTALVSLGMLSAAAMLLEVGAAESSFTKWNWWTIWLLGGPVTVGFWNLVRIWTSQK